MNNLNNEVSTIAYKRNGLQSVGSLPVGQYFIHLDMLHYRSTYTLEGYVSANNVEDDSPFPVPVILPRRTRVRPVQVDISILPGGEHEYHVKGA